MENKDISSKKQGRDVNNNVSNKNATHIDYSSKTASNSASNDPFYTLPGEGPKPRITSN